MVSACESFSLLYPVTVGDCAPYLAVAKMLAAQVEVFYISKPDNNFARNALFGLSQFFLNLP